MRRQFSATCKFLVHGEEPGVIDARRNAAPDDPAHSRIEPPGDPEAVQVVNRGAAGPLSRNSAKNGGRLPSSLFLPASTTKPFGWNAASNP